MPRATDVTQTTRPAVKAQVERLEGAAARIHDKDQVVPRVPMGARPKDRSSFRGLVS
jgi:hypothetical protein